MIRRRVTEMAQVIAEDYHGKRLIIVALLNGTVLFMADLVRHFDFLMSIFRLAQPCNLFRTSRLHVPSIVTQKSSLKEK